jgi:hypothetical protein
LRREHGYTDANQHADGHGDAYPDADGDCISDLDAYGNCYGFGECAASHWDTFANCLAHEHADGDLDRHGDEYTDSDADADTDVERHHKRRADADTNLHRDAQRHGDSDADAYANLYRDGFAHGDGFGNPDLDGDSRRHLCDLRDRFRGQRW